jgi:hypothetical protein
LRASPGVLQPRVFRGRVLRVSATASRSPRECRARSVPLGKYWRSRPLVLVRAPLPWAVRVAEVDVDPGLHGELGVLSHLRPLVPGQGAAELLGQAADRLGDGVTDGLRSMAGEGRTVLDAGFAAVAIHAGQVQERGEPRRPLDEGPDRRAVETKDEIALPMAGNGSVGSLGGPFADHDLRRDELLAAPTGAGPGHPQRSPCPQTCHQLALQSLPTLDVKRLVKAGR